jgi:hypothetical protein
MKSTTMVSFDDNFSAGDKVQEGIFSVSFHPASPVKFKEISSIYTVHLPRKGVLTKCEGSPFEGNFDLAPEDGTILFGDLLKVFLNLGVYPKLEANQRFVLNTVETTYDRVILTGRVIELVEE